MTPVGPRIGCYPGSFNPPTIAHLAVAEAACEAAALDRLDLVVSRAPLGKAHIEVPTLEDRLAVLAEVAAARPWLGVVVSDLRLVVDLAAGYDAVVMGADKWRQVVDPAWYAGGPPERDGAVSRLPQVLVAPRATDDLDDLVDQVDPADLSERAGVDRGGAGPRRDPPSVLVIPVAEHHRGVSATAVRAGGAEARAWMLPEAAAFDDRTGAWSDPVRYRRTP